MFLEYSLILGKTKNKLQIPWRMGPDTIGKGIVRRTIAKDDASSNTVTVLPTLIAHAAANPRVYAKIKFPDGG